MVEQRNGPKKFGRKLEEDRLKLLRKIETGIMRRHNKQKEEMRRYTLYKRRKKERKVEIKENGKDREIAEE